MLSAGTFAGNLFVAQQQLFTSSDLIYLSVNVILLNIKHIVS